MFVTIVTNIYSRGMSKNTDTSSLVDGILKVALLGSVVGVGLAAPNAIQAIDKPAQKILDKLDERSRKREIYRTIQYMKVRGLVRGDYSHGIEITKMGKKRLASISVNKLHIKEPEIWDGKWRVVFFDIPETKRSARVALTRTLRGLDYQLLQRSIWVHPYPSKDIIATVCEYYNVGKWLTYIETDHIDHEELLKKWFRTILKTL